MIVRIFTFWKLAIFREAIFETLILGDVMRNVRLKVALWEYVDGMAANCELIDVETAALELSRKFPGSGMNVDHIGREIKRAAITAKAALLTDARAESRPSHRRSGPD